MDRLFVFREFQIDSLLDHVMHGAMKMCTVIVPCKCVQLEAVHVFASLADIS